MNTQTGAIISLAAAMAVPEGYVEVSPRVANIVETGHRALAARRKRERINRKAGRRR